MSTTDHVSISIVPRDITRGLPKTNTGVMYFAIHFPFPITEPSAYLSAGFYDIGHMAKTPSFAQMFCQRLWFEYGTFLGPVLVAQYGCRVRLTGDSHAKAEANLQGTVKRTLQSNDPWILRKGQGGVYSLTFSKPLAKPRHTVVVDRKIPASTYEGQLTPYGRSIVTPYIWRQLPPGTEVNGCTLTMDFRSDPRSPSDLLTACYAIGEHVAFSST